jgi:serine protease AprX
MIMKKILFLMFLTVSIGYAQEDAWVYFKDKPDAAYYIANPFEMLSQKSLDRRAGQGIALDDKDVPINPQYIAAVTNINGVAVKAKSKWLNAVHVRGSVTGIRSLAQLAFVSKVDFADNSLDAQSKPDRERQPPKQLVKTAQKPQVNFNYGNSASQIKMLNGHLLHEQNFTGTGMTIAVLDAGFPGANTAQPFRRLYNNNLIMGGYNFVNRNNNVYTGGTHGTMVLSTMGGYTEGQLVGTAPDAAYYLFITEDVNSENPVEESYWVEAAEKADSLGVDVINTSLGYFEYDNPKYNYTYEDVNGETAFITRGANVAFTRGMMCVTSAGNSGAGSNPHIGVPADAPNTLTVGAVDSSRQYVSFSSIGPTFDMRIKPDVMAQGRADYVSDISGNITTASGTSFSSPITAGLVACLWQALPNTTNAELLQIIKQSADRYNNPDIQYGYGIPDFWKATQTALQVNDFEKEAFRLYPNPAKGIITISLLDSVNNIEVTIYNSLGQVVLRKAINSVNQFSVEHLPAGIYTYNLQVDLAIKTGKLVKE